MTAGHAPPPGRPAARRHRHRHPHGVFHRGHWESVPDGDLLARVKYPGEGLSPQQAVERAGREQAETSWKQVGLHPGQLSRAGGHLRGPRGGRLFPPEVHLFGRTGLSPQEGGAGVLARRLAQPTVQAGHLQRPRLRPTAAGTGRLPLRPELPAVLPGQPQPLRRQHPRPVRLDEQLRGVADDRRPEPLGQAPRQAGQDGRGRLRGVPHAPSRPAAGDQRTTACATPSTPTSCSCAAGCSPATSHASKNTNWWTTPATTWSRRRTRFPHCERTWSGGTAEHPAATASAAADEHGVQAGERRVVAGKIHRTLPTAR